MIKHECVNLNLMSETAKISEECEMCEEDVGKMHMNTQLDDYHKYD